MRLLNDWRGMLACMEACDSAFSPSVVGGTCFLKLFDKLYRNADMIAAERADAPEAPWAGYVAFYANDMKTRVAYITLLAVVSEMQGRQLGQRLLEACLDVARTRGMRAIRLQVLKDNDKAIRFYRRNGFEFEQACEGERLYMNKKIG